MTAPRAGLGQQAFFQMFRVVQAATTTTTTTTTTTGAPTTAPPTTTSTTTTTTPRPCKTNLYFGHAVDAQFDARPFSANPDSLRGLQVQIRDAEKFPLYSPRDLTLQVDDVVLCVQYNGQWYILAIYGRCPASTATTTTTTSTTTTSTTTPAPRAR